MGIGITIALPNYFTRYFVTGDFLSGQATFTFDIPNLISVMPNADGHGGMTFHALVVLGGGVFIMYTAIKEIAHMITLEEKEDGSQSDSQPVSVAKVIGWIVLMNLVFSFDSILSAIALTKKVWIISGAIIFSGVAMIALADKVSEFLQKNRMFEVLGFVCFADCWSNASFRRWSFGTFDFLGEHEVHAMNKATFYFIIITLVIVDLVRSRYQKYWIRKKHHCSILLLVRTGLYLYYFSI